MRFINNHKGVALLLTIMILTSVLVVALGVVNILQRSLIISRQSGRSAAAYLVAESGAERMLWEVRKDRTGTDLYGGVTFDADGVAVFDPALSFTSINLSNSVAKTDLDISGVAYSIATSTGTYFDAQRSIVIQYQRYE